MNKEQKAAVVEEIAGQIHGAEAVYAVDYRGISVPQAAELRARLRDADATFRIVKNSLTERAADQAGAQSLRTLLDGPTALTFVHGDAAVAAKAISDFARASAILEFKGGLLGGEELSIEQIQSIARLPARDVLYAQLVGTVASPLSGLVRGLNGLIGGIARQLQQIADQGLVGGADAAPPTPEAGATQASDEASDAPAADAPATQASDEAADAPATDSEPTETEVENEEASAAAEEKEEQ